jgi:hypothetical protein
VVGAGVEAAEEFIDAIRPTTTPEGGLLDWGVTHGDKMSSDKLAALQRARGLRHNAPGRVTPRKRRDGYVGWAMFKPVGFFAGDWVIAQAGIVDIADVDVTVARTGAGTVPDHAGVAHADTAATRPSDKRWASPYVPTPLFPRPSDGAALRYCYADLAADVARMIAEIAKKGHRR